MAQSVTQWRRGPSGPLPVKAQGGSPPLGRGPRLTQWRATPHSAFSPLGLGTPLSLARLHAWPPRLALARHASALGPCTARLLPPDTPLSLGSASRTRPIPSPLAHARTPPPSLLSPHSWLSLGPRGNPRTPALCAVYPNSLAGHVCVDVAATSVAADATHTTIIIIVPPTDGTRPVPRLVCVAGATHAVGCCAPHCL